MLNQIRRTGLAGLALAASLATILAVGFMSSPVRSQPDVSACPATATVDSIRKTLVPNVVYIGGPAALLVEGIAQKIGRQPYDFDVTEIVVYADPERAAVYEVGFAHQGCVLDVKVLPRHLWDQLVRETFGQGI